MAAQVQCRALVGRFVCRSLGSRSIAGNTEGGSGTASSPFTPPPAAASASSSSSADSKSASNSSSSSSAPAAAQPPAAASAPAASSEPLATKVKCATPACAHVAESCWLLCRHSHYQNANQVFVTVFAKNLKKDNVDVKFTEREVRVDALSFMLYRTN